MVNIKWKEAPVKDLVKIETGSRNTEDKNDDGQYPFFVRSQTVERIDSFHYDCEAVLTAGDGVGTGKVFHYINGKFDAHQRVYVMSQFKQEVLGKYFYYWFSKNFYAEVAKYQYIGNLSDYQNKNIKEDRLRQYLRLKGYADKLIDAAVMQLQQEAGNLSRGVYDANKTVYSRLKYGIPVSESPEKPPVTVELIDEANPLNNDFAIAEEVTVVEQQEKRPDLVIYLNGIAVAVIELKRSSISVSEGIRQNLTNQKDSFIRGFFTTMQFCMAGNESEGLRYGTLLTGEKFYMEWKDDGFKEHEEERDPVDVRISKTCEVIDNKLLKQIYAMFDKERFIDLIMNFVVFDKGIKKVCRYNQYFGIKRTQQRLNNLRTELHNPNRDQDKPLGGILWHTQGSGKTLTMVWLAKWILTHWAELNARVLIVTDRDELDEQIEKTFTGVDENIARTKSGKDLLNRLNVYDDSLICSLVHKFGRRGGEATENDYDKYIEELKASLPADFEAKGNLVVFVDECHRTQSGNNGSAKIR